MPGRAVGRDASSTLSICVCRPTLDRSSLHSSTKNVSPRYASRAPGGPASRMSNATFLDTGIVPPAWTGGGTKYTIVRAVFDQRTETTAAGEPNEPTSGFTCPRCGGVLWELAAPDELAFKCRIGHTLSLAAMLAEHGAQRRQAVAAARRHLAEAAALNRRVARWARERGHGRAATQLEDEAIALDSASTSLDPVETASLKP
jgi:hypothetical protein